MAENYSLNSKFGLNIKTQHANQPDKKVDLIKQTENLFAPLDNFFSKNEQVFNGNVEKEINMYSRQAMIVGMNLKASDNNIRRFDMNI